MCEMCERRAKVRPVALPPSRAIAAPIHLRQELPLSPESKETVQCGREEIRRVLAGTDDRVLLVVGFRNFNCRDALEFAKRLQGARIALGRSLLVVMRVDVPGPGSTCRANCGTSCVATSEALRGVRSVLSTVTHWGVPCAFQVRDDFAQFYLGDLVSYVITEETDAVLASSLAMPVGFKATFGAPVTRTLDTIVDSRAGDIFYGLTRNGTVGLVQSGGNPDCHVVVPALPRLFGQFSPVLHTLERQMQRRKAAGILLDLDPKNQTGGMQLMCDKIREDIAKSCGALLDADLSYKDEFSFTFIDLQQSMQDLVLAVEDRRALRQGELGSTPEEIAMARRIWKAVVPGGDMEPKLAKAFGLCTLHVGCDC
jgi:3-deoxy-D-arabino-heptulosonate 7-phosphate (DAHP) synthase